MTALPDFNSKPARAAYIGQQLAALYPETPIPLDHSDAYTLLVAVLLSVNEWTQRGADGG
jgi:endonuclease III